LKRLEKKLVPSKGWKKVSTTITWPFQKEEVKELLDTIERQKTLLILAQQNDHLYESYRFPSNPTYVNTHSELSKAIKNDMVDLRSEITNGFTLLRIG